MVSHGGFLLHAGCETSPPSVPRLVMTVCSGMEVEAESKPSSQPPQRGGLPERSACITTARSTNLVAYGTSRNVRSTLGEIRPKIPTAGQGRKLFCFRRHNCSISLSNNGPLNPGFLDNEPCAQARPVSLMAGSVARNRHLRPGALPPRPQLVLELVGQFGA